MSLSERYKRYTARRVTFGVVLLCLLVLGTLWALHVGSYALSTGKVVEALIGEGPKAVLVLWHIRLPRIAAAVVVGAGLAVAGEPVG